MRLVQRHRCLNGGDFSCKPGFVDASAAPDPVLGLAAIQRQIDRGGNGGIANAHFAQAQQIGTPCNRLHAKGESGGGGFFVQCRVQGYVAGGKIQRQFEHFQAKVEGRANLVDGRAAGGEIFHHRPRHRGRVGRHTLRHDAVVGGKHRHEWPVDAGSRLALPCRQPGDDVFQFPERSRRLGQLRIAGPHVGHAIVHSLRHQGEEIADIVEGQAGCGHDGLAGVGARS